MRQKSKIKFQKLIPPLFLCLGLVVGCGSTYLVVIEHPMQERLKTEKYKKIFVAGFCSVKNDAKLNIDQETIHYLRSELKKNTHFEVSDEKTIRIPDEKSAEILEDKEYWKNIAEKYESDLLIWGKVGYSAIDASGFRKMKVRSPKTGALMDVTRYVERTRFELNLEVYFHNGKDGEIVYQDSFNSSLLFREKRGVSLPIFFSLMNRILPDFLGILIPQPSTDSRYILP